MPMDGTDLPDPGFADKFSLCTYYTASNPPASGYQNVFRALSQAEATPFDISLDNVSLITQAQAQDPNNNCDPSMIGQAPGTGNEG